MEQALITIEGILLAPNGEPVRDPIGALASAVSLQKGCSLRSFFALIRRYPDLLRLSAFLPKALEEEHECPLSGCLHDDISALVVGKTMELIGFPGEPKAQTYLWLRGLAADKCAEAATVSSLDLVELMGADLDTRFVPMQILLDTPLLLGGLKHVVLGDTSRDLHCGTRFTLFDLVDGLAWEFGFRGGSQHCSLGG